MSTAVETRKFEKITSGKFKGMFKTVLSTGTMAVAKKGENGTYYVWHFISKDGEVRDLDNNFTRDSQKSGKSRPPADNPSESDKQAEALQ